MATDPLAERLEFAKRIASELDDLPHTRKLTDADAEATYSVAYNQYARGDYEAAFELFRMLAAFRPANKTYMLGAALCMHRLHRYDGAIACYSALSVMDPADPAHMLATAECQLLAQHRAEAQETLQLVIEQCDESKGHETVRARAQAMLELLRSNHHEPAVA